MFAVLHIMLAYGTPILIWMLVWPDRSPVRTRLVSGSQAGSSMRFLDELCRPCCRGIQ